MSLQKEEVGPKKHLRQGRWNMVTLQRLLLVGVLCSALGGSWCGGNESILRADACRASALEMHEAEILIYFLPVAQSTRKAGWQIGWELQTNPKFNQKDFFVFYVYNSTRPSNGSLTIGYFAVDKHTAEVLDTNADGAVNSDDLGGIQRILRKAHCIDESVIKAYSSAKPGGL